MDFQSYDSIFNESNYPKFRKTKSEEKFSKHGYNILPDEYSPCPCLSGKKYKFCCNKDFYSAYNEFCKNPNRIKTRLDKIYEVAEKNLISRKQEYKSINKKNISYCFAKNIFSGCDVNIVRSHTMSKGNVLRNLSKGEKLIKFNDHKIISKLCIDSIDQFINEKTISEASTTVSFCKKHDAELFSDIEKDGNTVYNGTYIENLEYALKSITFDLYHNILNIKFMSELFKESKYVASNHYFIEYEKDIKILFNIYPYAQQLLEDIKRFKEKNIECKTFHTMYINIPINKVQFSLSEVIKKENTICFFNIANIPSPYIIISYYSEKELDFCKKLKNIFKNSIKETEIFENNLWEITELALSQTQNIYFQKEHFKNLSNEAKFYIYLIHKFGMNYKEDPNIDYVRNNQKFIDSLELIEKNTNLIKKEILTNLYIK